VNIVFIDHDIDNYHANQFASLLAKDHPEFRLTGVYANRKDNLEAWAQKHQVIVAQEIEDLAPLADCVMVLAPSHPETHEDLCQKAFVLGKPTYVDKTFAPDLFTGRHIFEAADHWRIPIQSSSVLRYTEVQEYCRSKPDQRPRFMATWATGGNFDEYLIHPVEHVVSIMGSEFKEVTCREVAGFRQIEITFSDERAASIHMHVGHDAPYFSVVSHAKETCPIAIDSDQFFSAGMKGILNFFRHPGQAIDRRETIAILEILEKIRADFRAVR